MKKTVERLYITRDLELIAGAVDETARCLERMNLAQDFAKEAVERSRLDEMQQFRTEFFSRGAHDLRGPLTSISWSARNLLDGITGDLNSNQSEYLEGIENSSKQLLRLVNNLLEINRLEKAEVQIESIAVEMAGVLRQAVQELAPVAEGKNVRVDIIENDSAGPIRVDPQKLLEVVENLLENAIRYSPPGSNVEVRLFANGDDGQKLEIRDHGPGIADEDLDKIFDSFQQGKPSPYSAQQGFGVGLHVVKTYVDLMGGSVSTANHADGGALFECVFEDWHKPEVKISSH